MSDKLPLEAFLQSLAVIRRDQLNFNTLPELSELLTKALPGLPRLIIEGLPQFESPQLIQEVLPDFGVGYCSRCRMHFIEDGPDAELHIDCVKRDASDRADRDGVRKRNRDIARHIVGVFERFKSRDGSVPNKRFMVESLTRLKLYEHKQVIYLSRHGALKWLTRAQNAANSHPESGWRKSLLDLSSREGASTPEPDNVQALLEKMYEFILLWK